MTTGSSGTHTTVWDSLAEHGWCFYCEGLRSSPRRRCCWQSAGRSDLVAAAVGGRTAVLPPSISPVFASKFHRWFPSFGSDRSKTRVVQRRSSMITQVIALPNGHWHQSHVFFFPPWQKPLSTTMALKRIHKVRSEARPRLLLLLGCCFSQFR